MPKQPLHKFTVLGLFVEALHNDALLLRHPRRVPAGRAIGCRCAPGFGQHAGCGRGAEGEGCVEG
jgi:hypothetical protein